ncbi:MAG TPA: hypothetical protein VGF69_17185 [Thermoanaerobaculia bacterium]
MGIEQHALSWPALDLTANDLPSTISCERGIWGKVDGAPSDFRWIATTPGLAAPHRKLERELALGLEDAPEHATLWLTTGDTSYAIALYRSLAHDAAGRSGFLEKQLLEWKRPAGVPAALGALLLLPAVAALDTRDVFDQHATTRWSDDDPMDVAPVAPLPVSLAVLEEAIAEGIRALAVATTEDALTSIYADLLAGSRGVTLQGITTPLPPAAVAALLLPLPREVAERLSLAGWLPSTRLAGSALEEVRRTWDVILGSATTIAPGDAPLPTDEQLREARAMARSLLAAHRPTRAVPAREATAGPVTKPVQLALWGPSAAGKTALLAKLFLDANDEHWEVYPTQRSLEFIHGMRTRMKNENQFPAATAFAVLEAIEYRFRHRTRGFLASLQLEDRAGAHSEKLADEPDTSLQIDFKARLGTADGIVLLFDPWSDQALLESRVTRTLELLYVASERAGKDTRPIAVCVSKADILIETAADFRQALDSPDAFVRQRVAPVLVRALDRYCANYRLFPISAAGIRLRHGIVEPAVFIDEALEPRICPGGTAFNLMAPFSWLLDELTVLS